MQDAPHRGASRAADELVHDLERAFIEQVGRAIGVQLDGSIASLAFVDHHIELARGEKREAIVDLVAAGAGAYYGELVRRHIGGQWIGDGHDPTRLRFLLSPQFLYFSPVEQAHLAIVREAGERTDDAGLAHDGSFHLDPGGGDHDGTSPMSDADWIAERLSERPPVPLDEYYTLTCRFETLQLILELLAAKQASEGRLPREHGLDEYLHVLAGSR